MSGKQKADPFPAPTYAGFAASPPGEAEAAPELRLSGEARTYAREELRRRTARRRRAPVAAAAGLAVVAVGAAIGFALLYVPKANFAAPAPRSDVVAAAPLDVPAAPLVAPTAALTPPLPAPEPAAPVEPAPVAGAPVEVASVDTPAVEHALATPPAAAPHARPAPAKPSAAKGAPAKPAATAPARSSAQAAADRAATERVSALAALDQEVNKAYAEALNAGASPGPLSVAQEKWVIRRDRVQREDPDMAEDLARARIAELRALAAGKATGASAPEPPQSTPSTEP